MRKVARGIYDLVECLLLLFKHNSETLGLTHPTLVIAPGLCLPHVYLASSETKLGSFFPGSGKDLQDQLQEILRQQGDGLLKGRSYSGKECAAP